MEKYRKILDSLPQEVKDDSPVDLSPYVSKMVEDSFVNSGNE